MTERFRTYGCLTENQMYYRTSIGDNNADFITVGKLDNSKYGVYSYPSKEIEVYKDFHLRNDGILFDTI